MDEILKNIDRIRSELHVCPELSMQEHETKQLLMRRVRELSGLEVVDMGHWFYALWHGTGSGNAIAFRADFDAVAGADGKAGHFCGHDGHSAVLCGLAQLISTKKPERDVYLIFQHAEETGEGGGICSTLLEDRNISEVYAFHNTPGIKKNTAALWRASYACASTGLELRFNGTPAHAAYPEQGINPCRALSELVLFMDRRIKEPSKGMVLGTVVGVNTGKPAYGVSAFEGSVCMTLRAELDIEFNKLVEDIISEAERLAKLYGLKLSASETERFPSTENDPAGTEKVRRTAMLAGIECVDMPGPNRASEDFGYYLQKCSGAMFGIGDGEDYPGLHTAGFEYPDDISAAALAIFENLIYI